MVGVSTEFADWVAKRLVEKSAGVLTDELVFDERKTDLGMAIKQAVNSKLGCCVAMRAPRISGANGNTPDDTQYSVSIDVAVMHNAALSPKLNSILLSEHLFRQFAGVVFNAEEDTPADVRADNLTHELNNGSKWLHLFTITHTTTI